MRKKNYYIIERRNPGFIFMAAGLLFVLGVLIYLLATRKIQINSMPVLMAFGLLIIMMSICGIFWYLDHQRKQTYLRKRNKIINCGRVVRGSVADYKTKSRYNGDGVQRYHYAKVVFEENGEEKEYWTPELSFNPEILDFDEEVDVYIYKGEYHVDNFVFDEEEVGALWKWRLGGVAGKLLLILIFCVTGVALFALAVYLSRHGKLSGGVMKLMAGAFVALNGIPAILLKIWERRRSR